MNQRRPLNEGDIKGGVIDLDHRPNIRPIGPPPPPTPPPKRIIKEDVELFPTFDKMIKKIKRVLNRL